MWENTTCKKIPCKIKLSKTSLSYGHTAPHLRRQSHTSAVKGLTCYWSEDQRGLIVELVLRSKSENSSESNRRLFNRELRQFKGERIVFVIYSAGKTVYPHAKEWTWTLTLHHIQKLTKNGWKT